MKKSKIGLLLPLLVFVAAVCVLLRIGPAASVSGQGRKALPVTIVLDAGHGGADGGTIGRSGTVEKDINLAVTLRLNAFLEFFGTKTVLTRSDDRSLHGEDAKTIRQQKRADLAYRLSYTMEQERPVYIGIHQNFFRDYKSRGTQTFFSLNHAGSRAVAGIIQENVIALLQEGNKRVPAKAPAGVFLLKQLTCPAVIIECGFLSNPEEEMLLCSPEYQNKMAFSLVAGILRLTEDVLIE